MANYNGTSGNDSLLGTTGVDRIFGFAGNDTLDGNGGADIYDGGEGSDLIRITNGDNAGTWTTFDSGTVGTDTLDATRLTALLNMTTRGVTATDIGIEYVKGTSLNDVIVGGTANETLRGGRGNDVITGGGGLNSYEGGIGTDQFIIGDADVFTATYDTATDGVADTLDASGRTVAINNNGASNLNLTQLGIEEVVGTNLDDYIVGGTANESLIGGIGADTLVAGGGTNSLDGGLGNDYYILGSSADVVLANGGGTDTLDATRLTTGINVSVGAGATANINYVKGGSLNDALTGSVAAETLRGGRGDDVLTGGNTAANAYEGGIGNDRFVVGNADVFTRTYDTATDGARDTLDGSTVATAINLSTGGNLNLTALGIEYAVGGTGGANYLVGGSANETRKGGSGALDTLAGGAGVNVYIGTGGTERVVLGDADVLNATNIAMGAANDTLDGSQRTVAMTMLSTAAAMGIEQVVGSSLNDIIKVDASALTIANINGGTGTDTLDASGTATLLNMTTDATTLNVEYVKGTSLNDILAGGAAAETLRGGAGDDSINGGLGINSYEGGVGNDQIIIGNADVFTSTFDTGATGRDTLDALVARTVAVDNSTGLNLTQLGIEYFIGNAVASYVVGGSAAETLIGGGAADTLVGGTGADSLDGGAGNNVLNGGSGVNIYAAGGGNDLIIVGDNDTVVAATMVHGAGTDTLDASTRTVAASWNFAAGQTNVLAADFSVVVGTSLGDSLVSGAAAETLKGGAGNDTIIGGAAVDAYDGGEGNDNIQLGAGDAIAPGAAVVYDTGLVGVDTLNATAIASFDNTATNLTAMGIEYYIGAAGVNNGVGGSANETIIGGAAADVLNGGAGNDSLWGAALNDALTGGAGDDTLNGGAGTNTYAGDAGNDLIVMTNAEVFTVANFVGGTGTDTLDAGLSSAIINFSGANTLTAQGIEYVIGSSLADIVLGGANNETLLGGIGADSLNGGAGINSYDGGVGADTIVAGNTDVFTAAFDTSTDGLVDVLDLSITRSTAVNLSTTGNLNLTQLGIESVIGTSVGDYLIGGSVAETLSGANGNDTLVGAGGNDSLNGGAGADTFVFAGAFGSDIVADYAYGTDSLDLTAFNFGTDFSTGNMTASGGNLKFNQGSNSIVFEGITYATASGAQVTATFAGGVTKTLSADGAGNWTWA